MPDKRRQPPNVSEDELDALAEITPEDVADAERAWRLDANANAKDLLDAQPDDTTDPAGPGA
jgi:hypothetical protein